MASSGKQKTKKKQSSQTAKAVFTLLEFSVPMACQRQRFKKYFMALVLLNSCMLPALDGV